jgi:hypothetical protein
VLPIAFQPTDGSTAKISGTTTSARVILGGQPSPGGQRFQVRVTNDGTTVAYLKFGASTVTATTSDIPLMPGSTSVFSVTVPELNTTGLYAAAIMASGTANICLTTGAGIS